MIFELNDLEGIGKKMRENKMRENPHERDQQK